MLPLTIPTLKQSKGLPLMRALLFEEPDNKALLNIMKPIFE